MLNNCTLDDSLTALFYALSSSGNFDSIGLKVIAEHPYIVISKDKVHGFVHEVIDAWMFLVDQLVKAGEKLAEMPDKISTLVSTCADLPDKAKAICESAGLNFLDMAKIIKAVATNVARIAKAPSILVSAKDSLKEIWDAIKGLAKKLELTSLEKIHEIGKEINKAGTKTMRDIVVSHWPDKLRINLKLEKPKKVKQEAKT